MNIDKLEALRATRALITDPKHFTTGIMARDHTGHTCDPYDAEASSWCVIGAWERITGASDNIKSDHVLRKLCGDNLAHVNDSQGHEAVLEMLDKAIDREQRPRRRDTVRTAITIERVLKDSGHWVADATVGGWEREDAVRFPMSQLPEPYRTEDPETAEGKIFFCWANLEIEDPNELFFEDFEDDPAPEELVEFP
jgi:hypothetical protein